MFGLLSRSTTDCRLCCGFRVMVVGAQRNPQIVLKNFALSGFPTALEPTLRTLGPGSNASTVPANRRASQPPLPRDDLPPPPFCCRRARSLPPPPGPDYVAPSPSSSLKGAVWESRRELFFGGIGKSIVREGKFGRMCDLQHTRSGKKPAVGRNQFLSTRHKPPM